MSLRVTAIVSAMLFGAVSPAAAQTLSFTSKNSDSPITVTAEDGLDWQQNDKLFIARGNAKAVQDDTTVVADELVAHYRSKPKAETETATTTKEDTTDDTGTQVYRVDAIGHVTITTKNEVATGEAAVYDFDRKVLVLQGDTVTLVSSNGTVTAHKNLQYWQDQDVAVGEGDAYAVDKRPEYEGRTIKADKLTAFFREDGDAPASNAQKPAAKKGQKTDAKNQKAKSNSPADKDRDLFFLHGVGNVVLTTKTEVVRGDRGDYNLDTGMATVEGNVKMTRDNSQLNGGYAVVNVKGGVSHLYTNVAQANGATAGARARVRGLLTPKSQTTEPPKPMEKAP